MKRIVITGASSGIGLGVAREFAARGWRVGAVARRSGPLEQLAADFPGKVEYNTFDVADPAAPSLIMELIDRLGGLDVFLNAAGCGWYNPSLDPDDDRRTAATNVIGFTALTDTVFNYFAATGRTGRIAAITSAGGVKGLGISAAYSASKRYQWTYLQALEQLARIRRLPISFTDIRPGFIHTALLDRGPSHLPMTMAPDHAVKSIVRAIVKGKRIAVIDWRWAILCALWRRIPAGLWTRMPVKFR